jgi:Terminase large subunit, T4likevirus-type, N-terminal
MAITIAPGKTDIGLHPQQLRVLLSPANEILYGGAAGPGKSFLVRALAIRFCYEIAGFHAGLFRRTFRELQDTHMNGPGSFYELLAEGMNQGAVEIIKNEIRFANGSRISLNHCQREEDVYSYQGAEYQLLAIDELVHFTERQYSCLRTRVRLGGLKIPSRFKGKLPLIVNTSNPGGIGHEWVRKAFMPELPYTIRQMTAEEGGTLRQFIPATLADNPDTERNDPGYKNKLRASGDAATARALLEGDWDVVADSMWGEVWQKDLHVIVPFAIPDSWEVWRGADDGFKAPASCLWLTRDPILDRTYVIKELYKSGMLPEEFARLVLEGDSTIIIRDRAGNTFPSRYDQLSGIIDSASFAQTGQSLNGAIALPRGDRMNSLGCRWRPADKYSGSRVHGVQHIHHMLAIQPDGLPKLQIFNNCVNLCRALPAAPRDRTNAEDVDDEFELSHALDSLRYALSWKDSSFRRVRMTGM